VARHAGAPDPAWIDTMAEAASAAASAALA